SSSAMRSRRDADPPHEGHRRKHASALGRSAEGRSRRPCWPGLGQVTECCRPCTACGRGGGEGIERLREATNRSEDLPGLWVLIPSDEQHPMPVLDGVAVPVITPAQWARIPE